MQRPLRNSQRPHRSSPHSALRQAFSLIELMVVLMIITILAGLLLSGVMSARAAALNAAVVAEMKNFEKSIADFSLKFGVEPPSEIYLFEDPNGWSGGVPIPTLTPAQTTAAALRSRSLIREIWPQFNFALPRDINGDDDKLDLIHLTGAECLVFFLGGVNATNVVDKSGGLQTTPVAASTGAPIERWEPLGFSVNPANPFARGGSRLGPFYVFDSLRLVNKNSVSPAIDGEGMPEFLDSLPGQTKPYVYVSSYGGKGYRAADLNFGPGSTLTSVYKQSTGGQDFNPKSFQIISAGFDGEQGSGGALDVGLPPGRAVERDNITNFKGGRLE